MALQNPWGARKIHAELAKLRIEVSLATVSRYLPKRPSDLVRRQNWRTIQQLRAAFPNEHSLHDLIHDNDAIFSERLIVAIGHLGIESKRTADQSPSQNGIAEHRVGTVRRELSDHVIVIDENHLRRLLREHVDCYNRERVHTRLRDSPAGRPTENRPSAGARKPRIGTGGRILRTHRVAPARPPARLAGARRSPTSDADWKEFSSQGEGHFHSGALFHPPRWDEARFSPSKSAVWLNVPGLVRSLHLNPVARVETAERAGRPHASGSARKLEMDIAGRRLKDARDAVLR
jgi:hypothetical protein